MPPPSTMPKPVSVKRIAFMTMEGAELLIVTKLPEAPSRLKGKNPLAVYESVIGDPIIEPKLRKKIKDLGLTEERGHQVLLNAIGLLIDHVNQKIEPTSYDESIAAIMDFYGMSQRVAVILVTAKYTKIKQFIIEGQSDPSIISLEAARKKAREIYYDVSRKIAVPPWDAMELWIAVYMAVIKANGGTGPPSPGFWPP